MFGGFGELGLAGAVWEVATDANARKPVVVVVDLRDVGVAAARGSERERNVAFMVRVDGGVNDIVRQSNV